MCMLHMDMDMDMACNGMHMRAPPHTPMHTVTRVTRVEATRGEVGCGLLGREASRGRRAPAAGTRCSGGSARSPAARALPPRRSGAMRRCAPPPPSRPPPPPPPAAPLLQPPPFDQAGRARPSRTCSHSKHSRSSRDVAVRGGYSGYTHYGYTHYGAPSLVQVQPAAVVEVRDAGSAHRASPQPRHHLPPQPRSLVITPLVVAPLLLQPTQQCLAALCPYRRASYRRAFRRGGPGRGWG